MEETRQQSPLVPVTGQQTTEGVGLGLVRRLLCAFDREGIVYCHWKSNQHLAEGLLGITDLDVLFDRSAAQKVARTLCDEGYKRFQPTAPRMYPGMEDYLGVDEQTGKLIHVHAHYQLTLGEKNAKGFRLPWENLFLSTRHLQLPERMYATHPDVEMVILMVRLALKVRVRDRFLWLAGRPYMETGMDLEWQWLKTRVDPGRTIELIRDLLGKKPALLAMQLIEEGPSLRRLVRFRRAASGVLHHYRAYGIVVGRIRRWWREGWGIRAAIGKRYTHPAATLNRTVASGGVMVAFLGADGAGKSTVVKEIVRWLSWKTDVLPVYHGSGDGPASLARLPLKLALMLLVRQPSATPAAASGPASRPGSRSFARRFRPLWALVLSYEKRRKLSRASRARNRGMVVVCDRYPQNQVSGFNDGPLLGHWLNTRSRILRALARWEGVPYYWAERFPPDLVVKLNVSPRVARQRKPEMDFAEIQRRVETIRRLEFPKSTIVEIDADAPLEEVLLNVKRAVWAVI